MSAEWERIMALRRIQPRPAPTLRAGRAPPLIPRTPHPIAGALFVGMLVALVVVTLTVAM